MSAFDPRPLTLGPRPGRVSGRLQCPLHLFHPERLDAVAHLEIVEVLDPDAALETLTHLADVVLEALEARERAGVDHHAVSHDPGPAGALDGPAPHGAAGDRAHLAHLEELEHLGL